MYWLFFYPQPCKEPRFYSIGRITKRSHPALRGSSDASGISTASTGALNIRIASTNSISKTDKNINPDSQNSFAELLNTRIKEIKAERLGINVKLLPGGVLNANNDALTKEYSRIKSKRDALEKQRAAHFKISVYFFRIFAQFFN